MKMKDSREIISNTVKVLLYLYGFIALCLFIFYNLNDKWSERLTDEPVYIEEWTVIDPDGNSFTTGRQYKDKRLYTRDFTIISRIPDSACEDSILCFANRGNVEIYIDGELRKSFDSIRDTALPQGAVKRFYMTVPLQPGDAGKELKIVKHGARRRSDVVSETFISGMGGIYSFLIRECGITFALAEILFVMSIVVILVGFGMMIWYRQRIDMFFAAVGILITASWSICDSYLYPYAFGHFHIDGILSYLLCLMMPFGFLLYLDSIQKGRHWRIMSVLFIVSTVNLLLWSTLHFTGILPFSRALEIMDSVLGMVVVGVLVTVVLDYKNGYAKDYKYTAFGFLLFTLLSIWEIVNVVVIKPKNDGAPMVLGLLVLLTFVVLQQVDELRKIADEKQRAIELSDAKTNFLASMSHEIRTPINSIIGMNEMILRENKEPSISEYARTVQSSGKMLLSLINDVLDFSKIEAGRLEITNEEFSVSRMLSEVSMMVRERADAKGLSYTPVIDGEVPGGIVSDEVRIRQVLINLINNAIKYTDKGGVTLKISGEFAQGDVYHLKFNVIDTGRGIKKEDQKDLFDAFTRADVGKNRNIEGTGLGLAIVKSIVDSLNGKITVVSEYQKGSDFGVEIPVNISDGTPVPDNFLNYETADIYEEKQSSFTAKDAQILTVDDNQPNLSIVELFLKRTGITPDTCLNGLDAIDKCRKKKYDLILLDHMMPEPDGIETLRLIRTDEDSLNRDTAAVVLTANVLAGSREMYLAEGFADYLTKPLDSKKLEEVVREYLPADKIVTGEGDSAGTDAVAEAADAGNAGFINDDMTDLQRKLSAIEGMDYDTAMSNCGDDEEILLAVLNELCDEAVGRIEDMRRFVAESDFKNYGINAHAVKGLMATIGMAGLSERAKKHEFAAKEGNNDFILEDYEGFIEEYENVCRKLR
ncbi:MAG: response regulator [Lachnospiraceae bacterium]|nr:response regulator [Lachnospiraceae bacterium]